MSRRLRGAALPWSGNVVPIAPFSLRKGSSLIAPDQNPLGRCENSDVQFIVIVRDKNAQKVATMSVTGERFTTPRKYARERYSARYAKRPRTPDERISAKVG